MNFKNRFLSAIITVLLLMSYMLSFSAAAVEAPADSFFSYGKRLICVSHRGDTAAYPENSLAGVKSALKKGADFVSVSIDKTSDGVFYLCERESLGNVCNAPYAGLSQMSSDEVKEYNTFDIYGNLTEYKLTSLEELISKTKAGDGIILDVLSEDKDAVYELLSEHGVLSRMIIRTDDSCKRLVQWAEGKPERVYAIGVYGGNIIFSTVSAVKGITAAQMPAVQYESKNYFNVAFGEFFTNRYITKDNARALACAYSPDLCGQRSDSAEGWNELIKKGYSVIETDNLEAFAAYRSETERLEAELRSLLISCEAVSAEKFSQVSLSNFAKARENCEALLNGAVFSLDEAQSAYSQLIFALEEMKVSDGKVDTRGALNVTAGKLVAAFAVGALLLAGQIYVYKMRRKAK